MFSDQVIRLEDIGDSACGDLRAKNSAMCFGHFDVVHPGHIRYFQGARKHCEYLIVAISGDKENEAPDALFTEIERAEALGTLELVDLVVILGKARLADAIEKLNPNSLVLGREFKDQYRGGVEQAVTLASSKGCKVLYDAGDVRYASSDLLRNSPESIEQDRWRQFSYVLANQEISLPDVLKQFSTLQKGKLVVVGDTIVDHYVACDPLGMSSEAPVIVVKELEERNFLGGGAVVAAHIAGLGASCEFVTVLGSDKSAQVASKLIGKAGVKLSHVKDESRPTTTKTRYLVDNQKLFRVSRLEDHELETEIEEALLRRVEAASHGASGIVVSDFVYGVVSPRVVAKLKAIAARQSIPLFGDLQCSSQVGSILKFTDFTSLFPTEREARIALENQHDGVEQIARELMDRTRASNLVLKMGGSGFIVYESSGVESFTRRQHFPSLCVNPVDVSGAGDALLAAVATLISSGFQMMEACAFGACVAAINVGRVGNIPTKFDDVREFVYANTR